MIDAKDLQALKAAAGILDQITDDDALVEKLNQAGGRPYVASDELERLLLALGKVKNGQ